MNTSSIKNFDELPLFLNAQLVSRTLGVSPSSAYELLHEDGFPSLRIGSRLVVPKEQFVYGWSDRREARMRNKYYTSRDPIKNYFPLPNEVFTLGLSPGALAVYSYLMYIEDRTTYQCHASYKTIGKAVNMSPNTVRKYVAELVERGLIQTEHTSIITQDGRKQNGSLLYTLLPIQFSIQQFYEQKLAKLDAECEQERIRKRLEAFQQAQQKNACPPA